jgi:hypothetical protein
MVKQMNPIRYALIVSALLAAGAFYPNHSYNYFVLLKWVLCGTSIWAAVIDGEKKRIFTVAVFCAIALIHNPIMKFHFERDVWLVIDGISAAWFIFQSTKKHQK